MTSYDRSPPTDYRLIDEFDGGLGWFAHPDEDGQRASHALIGERGRVWLFDPLEAPGIDDEIEALGPVAGVVVCSNYHARDAAAFARRYDVPVFVPSWLERVRGRVAADGDVETADSDRSDTGAGGALEVVDGELDDSGYVLREASPFPGWDEAIAYRRSNGTLYVPDLLGTAPPYLLEDERLAVYLLARLAPPTAAFAGIAPERVLLGHGAGVLEDAAGALADAFASARPGFPRALVTNGRSQLGALVDAL